MIQEERNLLLKDLCARLPYGVIINIGDNDLKLDRKHQGIGILYPEDCSDEFNKRNNNASFYITISGCYYGEKIKPYLRPISSMTEEERKEYKHLVAFSGSPNGAANFVDWLNKKMFAYRTIDDDDNKDMFKLGLALEAPKGMYK